MPEGKRKNLLTISVKDSKPTGKGQIIRDLSQNLPNLKENPPVKPFRGLVSKADGSRDVVKR